MKTVYLEDCYTVAKATTLLNCGMYPADLLDWLFMKGILDEEGKANRKYVEQEYVFTKATMYPKGSNSPRLIHVPYFTEKGIQWLRSQLQ
jgi:hypothetical protein